MTAIAVSEFRSNLMQVFKRIEKRKIYEKFIINRLGKS